MRKLANSELDRLSVEEFKKASRIPVVVILDNIRSLNNIGSVFRTADAFRAEAIYLCGITACPPHREINKTALGATESMDWKYFKETHEAIKVLKDKGYRIYVIEQADESIMLDEFDYDINKKVALIFGHEVAGVQESVVDQSDACIEIPQFGTKHSVNVSVSVGIVIWDFFRRYKRHLYRNDSNI